jgi:hypothetical protein
MSRYRIYILDRLERIAASLEEAFEGDQQAVKCAKVASVGQYAAEVWNGPRLVARLGGQLQLDLV